MEKINLWSFSVDDIHGSKIGVKYAEVLRQSFFIPKKVAKIEEL